MKKHKNKTQAEKEKRAREQMNGELSDEGREFDGEKTSDGRNTRSRDVEEMIGEFDGFHNFLSIVDWSSKMGRGKLKKSQGSHESS